MSNFETTRWSLVERAALPHDEERLRDDAWEEIYKLYKAPLLAFVYRSGFTANDAEDLIHGFFARVVEKDWLAEADPQRGKLRTFLLNRLNSYVLDRRRFEQAQKRGGGEEVLTLNEEIHPSEGEGEEVSSLQFDKDWATVLLDRAFEEIEKEANTPEKSEAVEILKAQMSGKEDVSANASGAVRTRLHRIRAKLRDALRREVAQTLVSKEDLAEEMRYLSKVLSQSVS